MNELNTISNQRIIIQSTNQTAPHLEAELEIIELLLNQNNEVYWLQCNKEFNICYYNPFHKKTRCMVCFSKVKNGEKIILKNNTNIDKLHIINYRDFLSSKNYYKKNNTITFSSLEELKTYKYNKYDVGLAATSSLVSHTRDHQPDIEKNTNFINKAIQTGNYLYDTSLKIIETLKPNLVILFNGRFIENRPLLRACQYTKTPYATHEKGGRLTTFLFRKNAIPHSIEAIHKEMEYLWENGAKNKKEIGENFFLKKIKGVEDAWHSFTKEQQQGLLPASIKEAKKKKQKIITIFNSSLDEYEGLEGFGPYFYKDDNTGIKKIAEDLQNNKNIKLYLRVHPNLRGLNNTQMQFINKELKAIPSIEIIAPEAIIDTYALTQASDAIIVFGSTIGIESAFINKKVFLLGRAAYEKLNCCYIPKNHHDLLQMLTKNDYIFPELDIKNAIKYGYWNEVFGINHINYNPIGFNKGKYREKYIKANFFKRKLRQLLK